MADEESTTPEWKAVLVSKSELDSVGAFTAVVDVYLDGVKIYENQGVGTSVDSFETSVKNFLKSCKSRYSYDSDLPEGTEILLEE